MRVIQIKNSYQVWKPFTMRFLADGAASTYHTTAEKYLHRSYRSMYIEWWLHNIGYYISLPLKKREFWRKINLRCKDVDLEEHEV